MAEPIVIGVALRDDDRAPLALGLELVRFMGAPLALAHVFPYDTTAPVATDTEAAALEGAALLTMASVAARLGDDLEVTLHAEPNTSRVRGLRAAAGKLDASLLVVGASHRGRVGKVVPGGAAERLLHAAPCALAVAPRDHRPNPRGIRRIGVAFVDTTEGYEALDAAATMAALGDTSLTIYTVVDRPAATRRVPAGVAGTVEVLEGDVAHALAAASAELDLLVCGSRGFGPLHSALTGGVSATLAHSCACPLIVLPRERHRRAEAQAGLPIEQPSARGRR
jgi:nucleotide-binding universal stress UspA family protein